MEIKSRDKLEPGDVLAKPIYNSNGVALLPAGAVLSESNIDRLQKDYNDISEFFCVDTPGTENIIIEDNIGEEVRIKTSIAIRNKQIREIIEQSKVISHQIINYNIHDVDFYDTRNKSDYVTRHAVNVAIVSCIIAKSMGYSEKELEEITLAGLLHDFARSNQSDSNIEKLYTDRLKCKKEEILPYLTVDLLKDTDFVRTGEISQNVLGSILCHHEHQNGQGYYKVPAEIIKKHKYASILHVADIYDTLSNNDTKSILIDLPENALYLFNRSGGMTPKNIITYFMKDYGAVSESQRLFDPTVVKHFIKCVSIYSKGRRVKLSNGDIAVVNRNFLGHSDRPEVVVIDGALKGKTINLTENVNYLNLSVIDYVHDEKDNKLKM